MKRRPQESVQDTINHAFPTSTMLAVAHRLETIMEFDQVNGLESGSPGGELGAKKQHVQLYIAHVVGCEKVVWSFVRCLFREMNVLDSSLHSVWCWELILSNFVILCGY